MSREWGLHCKTCDACSVNDFNHGESLLRTMVKVFPHIKTAQDVDTYGYLNVTIAGYGYLSGDFFEWLEEHAKHDLELEDEYGHREPLEETPA